jgi:hypothetical protein
MGVGDMVTVANLAIAHHRRPLSALHHSPSLVPGELIPKAFVIYLVTLLTVFRGHRSSDFVSTLILHTGWAKVLRWVKLWSKRVSSI